MADGKRVEDKKTRNKRRRKYSSYLALLCLVLLGGLVFFALRGCSADRTAQALQQQLDSMKTDLEAVNAEKEQLEQKVQRLQGRDDPGAPAYTRLYPEMYAADHAPAADEAQKTVYLTFDDGPSVNTDSVLDTLAAAGAKATFFVVGTQKEEDQERMRRIVQAGHTLGVHSWSHDYQKIYASVEAFLEDFHQMYEWIYQVTGTYPQVFRFPGGSLNSYNGATYMQIIAEMTRRGFVYFDWNVASGDAAIKAPTAEEIKSNALTGIGLTRPVVLFHDSASKTTTAEMLPEIVAAYQAAGYRFGALSPAVVPVVFGYRR